jgi:T5SS/PEP-CTERM-associated repeat protein
MINFCRLVKALLLAGLLGSLALSARAQNYDAATWAAVNTAIDGSGNTYAFWNDPANWSTAVVPGLSNSVDSNLWAVHFADAAGNITRCIVTNNTQVGQVVVGDYGAGGYLVITNGASFQAGLVGGNNWTGVGFPNGPGTLYVGPNSVVSLGSHLWVGNGPSAQGTVIVDGGTINIPNGQLGVGWNGSGGTNYLTIQNGGKVVCGQWNPASFGPPGNPSTLGILNLADNTSTLVINGNQTASFNNLVTNHQFLAYGGLGTISWNYNPSLNVSTVLAIAPVDANTPIFSTQPTNVIVALGTPASLHALVSNVPVNYGWLLNNVPLADGGGITGSHTATLTIANVTSVNVGNYSVVATNQNFSNEHTLSTTASVSADSFTLYPVITINGVPGNTYVVQYTSSLTPPVTWTPLATNTLGGPIQYVIDTNSPLSMKRFYSVIQQ